MAAGAALLFRGGEFAFAVGKPKGLLDAADETALQFVGKYSGNVLMYGGSVAAKLAGEVPANANILAQIGDLAQMNTILSSPKESGIPSVFVNGNTASFTVGGRSYDVENLLPDQFVSRLGDLQSGRNVTFAHDAITLRPVNGTHADPLRSGRALRLMIKDGNLTNALQDVFEGLVQTHQFGLSPDARFGIYKAAVLGANASDPERATTAATIFIKYLTALSDAVHANGVTTLLKSRLLTTAFVTELSVKTSGVVSDFRILRARLDSKYSDAAIWLAIILAPEIGAGTSDEWIQNDSYARAVAARAALQQAKAIIDEPAFIKLQASN